MAEFKETERLWFDYASVHQDCNDLFDAMQAVREGPAHLIAVGRGGWLPSRLVAASYEANGLGTSSSSVQSNYTQLGSPDERAEITQGLDNIATSLLKENYNKGYSVWLIDGPYMAGRTMQTARQHVAEVTGGITPYLGVLHWIEFFTAPEAPWRRNALQPPDAYARKISRELKPYVEYPWEYPSYEAYQEAMK